MKWISVNKKLPEYKYENQPAFDILILAKNNRYYTGYVITEYSKTEFFQHSGRKILNVTHWMPLPKPPKNN